MTGAAPSSTRPDLEARYYTGRAEAVGELVQMAVGQATVFTCPSPLHPERNEDGAAVFHLGDSVVMAVADGVGGIPGGAVASTQALEHLGLTLSGLDLGASENELRNAIMDGLESGHQTIKTTPDGGATTMAVAEIQDGHVRTYHAGDSAILVIGDDGTIKLQTVSHSPVGYALESGLLDEREALTHESRNVIFNCLGLDRLQIEYSTRTPLAPGDTVLLGSDGLFDNLSLAELSDLVGESSLDAVCQELADLARERMQLPVSEHPSKPDDLTFIVFRLSR